MLLYAVRPCFAVCALLGDAAAVGLLVGTAGTVWLALICLLNLNRTTRKIVASTILTTLPIDPFTPKLNLR